MKYRDAKEFKEGDQVKSKDEIFVIVTSIEIYGQYKTVRVNGKNANNKSVSFLNNELED